MNGLVLAVGALLTGIGLWSMIAVRAARQSLRWLLHSRFYGISMVLRLLVGLALVFGAQATKLPAVTLTVGIVFLLETSLVPLLGEERMGSILAWWLERPRGWTRAWGAAVAALGLFIGWLAV